MRTSELLEKLFAIERSLDKEDEVEIRSKLMELEEDVLLMQRNRIEFYRNRCEAHTESSSTDTEPTGFKYIISSPLK